jgi:CHAD domain-containing protein
VLLHETLPRLKSVLVNPPLGQGLARRLQREATAARQAALAAISGPIFTRLVLEMGRDLLAHPGPGRALRPWAAECLERRWQRLLKRGKGFGGLKAAQRHRLRIAVKRLRYTADALASLFARNDKFIARLATLQNRLGASQDGVVAVRLISGLDSRSAAILFDAGRLVGVLAGQMAGKTTSPGKRGGKAWRALGQSRPFWRARKR